MKIAKLMINTGLPIKCLEATVLGIYLTNSLPLVERFSISFKSELDYKICRHIVLAVKIRGKYGAIGLSRKDDLHWKKPIYKVINQIFNILFNMKLINWKFINIIIVLIK